MLLKLFYSHVNYSVTKMPEHDGILSSWFYSHVNYSVTKITMIFNWYNNSFTVT